MNGFLPIIAQPIVPDALWPTLLLLLLLGIMHRMETRRQRTEGRPWVRDLLRRIAHRH
jgi:hypothetical protein